jgi:hypothetical protein
LIGLLKVLGLLAGHFLIASSYRASRCPKPPNLASREGEQPGGTRALFSLEQVGSHGVITASDVCIVGGRRDVRVASCGTAESQILEKPGQHKV